MNVITKQFLNSLPDKRVAGALTRVFSRVLPNGTDTALTAHAGGTQAAALALNPNVAFHEVTTVASAADSIKLPPALIGEHHFVKNSGAGTMQVFGAGTDTVDSVATATGVPQLAGDAVLYVCVVNGNYIRLGGVQATEAFTAITTGSLAATAGITSSGATGAGIGYATGAGGAVTQATNRTTGVTLSKLSGQVTTNNASLAAEAAAKFTVTNTAVAIGDVVAVSQQSGSNGGNTAVNVVAVAAGSFDVQVSNNNASGGTAETGAIIINYAVIKSVAA